MSGGLAALLDDIALIAKAASSASTKAIGVVVDDTAVTPQYVRGFSPSRELPIIGRIARGSLVNKAILIVLLLVLDTFMPQILIPLLMFGGLYLSYEGAEKVWELITGHGQGKTESSAPIIMQGADHEKMMVKGAILTDFVLSAEIMVISLSSLNEGKTDLQWWGKAIALVIIAVLITVGVYGVCGLIVKLDDIGLHLSKQPHTRRVGTLLVSAMPNLLSVLSTVGIAAMLWVGGHILLSGADKLGWHEPYGTVHHLERLVQGLSAVGGLLVWLVETLCSAIVGLVVGALVVAVIHVLPFGEKEAKH